MAEMFADAGYTTAMFGKWHLGGRQGRFPTDQGFDEWWGIPNSTDESWWANNDRIPPDVKDKIHPSEILSITSKAGQPTVVKPYDLKQRPLMDGEPTDKTIDYIDKHAKAGKPFFIFLPFTLTHQPRLPRPEFAGKTGNRTWGDLLSQIDYDVGRIPDSLDTNGIANDTIVIFTSDNGGDFFYDGSFPGMWRRGTYFTRP